MSLELAYRLCREWQARLGLKDWRVTLRLTTIEELPDTIAESAIVEERKVCDIAIRWPHVTNEGMEEDLENTVVHELVHCFFSAYYPKNSIRERFRVHAIEHAVDSITTALVQTKRRSSPTPTLCGYPICRLGRFWVVKELSPWA